MGSQGPNVQMSPSSPSSPHSLSPGASVAVLGVGRKQSRDGVGLGALLLTRFFEVSWTDFTCQNHRII